MFICGDEVTEIAQDVPPLAPRVGIVANMQANTVLEVLLNQINEKMKITLNNNPETLEGNSINVNELLKMKNFTFKMLIIKINGKLIGKEDYGKLRSRKGMIITVMHLISGG